MSRSPEYKRAIADCIRIIRRFNNHMATPETRNTIRLMVQDINREVLNKPLNPNRVDWENIAKQHGYRTCRDMLIDWYADNGLSAIARYLGVSVTTLKYQFTKFDIPLSPKGFDSPKKANSLRSK